MSFLSSFIESNAYSYILIPILIFMARVTDQTMGMLRIILATKGLRLPAFIFGFFESFIWLMAIGQIMSRIDNIFYYFVYAAGFATGNVVGIYIEKKLSIGYVAIRVVFQRDSQKSIQILREKGYGLTIMDAVVDASDMQQPVKMLFSTIKRKEINDFIYTLSHNNPTAFYIIEDVKQVQQGYISNIKHEQVSIC